MIMEDSIYRRDASRACTNLLLRKFEEDLRRGGSPDEEELLALIEELEHRRSELNELNEKIFPGAPNAGQEAYSASKFRMKINTAILKARKVGNLQGRFNKIIGLNFLCHIIRYFYLKCKVSQ